MKYLLILLIFLAGFFNESAGQSSQKEAKQLYFSAIGNYENNNFKSCISDLQKAKKILKSTNFKIQPLLIKALFKSYDYERTLKEISKYKALKPNSEWAEYHELMQIKNKSVKHIKQLQSEYNKLLLTNKISPHYKFRKNNPKSSLIKKLNKRIDSLEYLPQNAIFVNQIAFKQYNKYKYQKAIELFKKVLVNSPKNYLANYWSGQSYYWIKDYNSAYSFFKNTVEIKPQDHYSNYWFGRVNYAKKSYQTAIKYFKQALSIASESYDSNYWLGQAYYKEDDLDSAAKYFEAAVKLKPNDYYANYWLGQAYSDKGQHKAAVPLFEKSSQLKADDFWSQYLLGYSYANIDEYTKAYEYLKKAISIKTDHSYSNYHLAYVHFLRREYSLATKYFKIALKLNPTDIHINYFLAKSYYKNGDMTLAKKYFNKTIELEKEDKSSFTAYAYLHMGFNEKAFNLMESLEKKADNNNVKKSLHYDYACLYSWLNNRKEAIKHLEVCLKLGYYKFKHIDFDADFDNIREHRSFKKLIEKYRNKT